MAMPGVVQRLLDGELTALRSAVRESNLKQCLRALDQRGIAAELIRQQYTGRYPFELLQNANDSVAKARDNGAAGRKGVLFVITNSALIVADMGAGFADEDVDAICHLGRTSKDPRKTIGYKGLGFKSVGQITETPQIFSRRHQFQFSLVRARHTVESIVGTLEPGQHIPVYAFPFPLAPEDLGEDRDLVMDCLRAPSGYETVLRMPFKEGIDRALVEKDIVDLLSPRIVLLLGAVDTLTVRGIATSFSVERFPGNRGDALHVGLEIKDNSGTREEKWLIFEKPIDIPNRQLVEKFGDNWARVQSVRLTVAVPLREDTPDSTQKFNLHVYFPTDESCGFAFIAHGDFALDLDRRRISQAPEKQAYNTWLAKELARFVAQDVAPSLSRRFDKDPEVVAVLAPKSTQDSTRAMFSQELRAVYVDDMKSCDFIPTMNGARVRAARARLLPDTVPDILKLRQRTKDFLDLSRLSNAHMVTPEVESILIARQFLSHDLKVPALTEEQALAWLRSDIEDPSQFYDWLLAWADHYRNTQAFVKILQKVPCIRTTNGKWLPPSKNIFFPREREAFALPTNLPICIASVPDDARPLLEKTGISHFRWREVIQSSVLPILVDRQAGQDLRDSAHQALRTYFESEGGNDKEILSKIGEILLPVRSLARQKAELLRADQVYFSSEWLDSERLEQIYGPFEKAEFLNWPVPDTAPEKATLKRYFAQIGVASCPRVIRSSVSDLQSEVSPFPSLLWKSWLKKIETQLECPQGHPRSHRAGIPYAPDRFEQLAKSRDFERLRQLFLELAEEWHEYAPMLSTIVTCQHNSHGGADGQRVPSFFLHTLEELNWVPAQLRGNLEYHKPRDVWRPDNDIPERTRPLLPMLSRELEDEGGALLGPAIGLVDGSRAGAKNYIAILQRLATETKATPGSPLPAEVVHAAGWAMRKLNDALEGENATKLEAPPLLARQGERYFFIEQPYIARDDLLEELWRDRLPLLAADQELRHLHRAFKLRDLKSSTVITPRPESDDAEKRDELERDLRSAAPYLAAIALKVAPSMADKVHARLPRISIVACKKLILEYSRQSGETLQHPANIYLARREEKPGSPQGATIYVQVTDQPDIYALGRQLAQFVEVPTQGDAFALILKGEQKDRDDYLASRRISRQVLEQEEQSLRRAQPEHARILEDLIDPARLAPSPTDAPTQSAPPSPAPDKEPANKTKPKQRPQDLPPIEEDKIRSIDVVNYQKPAPRTKGGGGSGGGGGHPTPSGSLDWEAVDEWKRERGKRGEEAALAAERKRIKEAGLDPSLVVWESQRNDKAVYDIRSLKNGLVFYIEVKATQESRPETELIISEAELRHALQHGPQYAIHRVVDVDGPEPTVYRYEDIRDKISTGAIILRLEGARMRLPRPED